MAWWKIGIATACVLGGGMYGLQTYAFALQPATPPLLKGIRGAGGWGSGGCPPSTPFDKPEREVVSQCVV
ncbi:hypothetical protein ASG52_18120 [Methylobacterium sp. Leaf456]|nr:hypothetical protein ASG52_18120 [Methylobacterium sp. Leaf456]